MLRARRAIAAIAAAIAALAAAAGLPAISAVTVRAAAGRVLLAALPCGRDQSVVLDYIHSANRGAVRDTFAVDDDGALVLTGSLFESFGAGMSDGYEPGVVMNLTSRGVELSGLRRKIGVLRLAVGTVAGHRFSVGPYSVALADLAAPQTSILIAYERIPLFAAIRGRIRHD